LTALTCTDHKTPILQNVNSRRELQNIDAEIMVGTQLVKSSQVPVQMIAAKLYVTAVTPRAPLLKPRNIEYRNNDVTTIQKACLDAKQFHHTY